MAGRADVVNGQRLYESREGRERCVPMGSDDNGSYLLNGRERPRHRPAYKPLEAPVLLGSRWWKVRKRQALSLIGNFLAWTLIVTAALYYGSHAAVFLVRAWAG